MLRKPYLQDLKAKDIPDDFHVARWHLNGKLWVAKEAMTEQRAREVVSQHQAIRSPGAITTPYFVWHAGMTEADLEPYKASEPR